MRDGVIAVGFIGALVGAFIFLHRTGNLLPNIGTAKYASSRTSPKRPSQKLLNTHGDHRSERPNRIDPGEAQTEGQSEGSSVDSAEIESIASIYKKQRPKRVKTPVEADESGDDESAPRKVIHGVSVAAWVQSRQDQLPTPVANEVGETGIRVFLQCMELKKDGPEALKERDCEAISRNGKKATSLAAVAGPRSKSATDEYR